MVLWDKGSEMTDPNRLYEGLTKRPFHFRVRKGAGKVGWKRVIPNGATGKLVGALRSLKEQWKACGNGVS